jgi:hypothetical protein
MRDTTAHKRDRIDASGQLLDRGFGRAISAADMAALTHAFGRNTDGGEVVISVEWGKDGKSGPLDLEAFASQAKQPRDVTPRPQLEDKRPQTLAELNADVERMEAKLAAANRPTKLSASDTGSRGDPRWANVSEAEYRRAVAEGRVVDMSDEASWPQNLPPKSHPEW